MEKRQRRGFFPFVPFFFRIVGMTLLSVCPVRSPQPNGRSVATE